MDLNDGSFWASDKESDAIVMWKHLGGKLNGEICWKCKGNKYLTIERDGEIISKKECSVCKAIGRLYSLKRKRLLSKPGEVRPNTRPFNWKAPGRIFFLFKGTTFLVKILIMI